MSIATKQLQQSYHSSIPQPQQQRRPRTFHGSQPQLNATKSIESTGESNLKHVANREIKTRQLLRQTTVAVTETEARPEKKKHKSEGQQINEIIVNELEDTYFNECGSSGAVAEDYQIYQNGQVNEFFQNDIQHATKVADICLVNDHYILVKMTDQETATTNHNNLAEAAACRKEFRQMKQHNDNNLKVSEKGDKKLCRYLRSKRNRITKIAPIHEEPDEDLSEHERKSPAKSYCIKMQSCWQGNSDEVETHQSQTKIHKKIPNPACDRHQKTSQLSSAVKLATEKSPCLDIPKAQRDIQTISGSILQSSLQYQVSLHNYGSLIESQSNTKTGDFIIKSPRRRRKCPRLETFRWLWQPFRGKYRKTKPKIQAVVYKTYFVKWTKPPDTLNHGYGVKSLKSSHAEMFVLRRCRSATF